MFRKKELKTTALVDDDGNVISVLIELNGREELLISMDRESQLALTNILDGDFLGNSNTRIYKKIADESEMPENFMYRR